MAKREKWKTVTDFIFLVSKITADDDCSHEIKICFKQRDAGSICVLPTLHQSSLLSSDPVLPFFTVLTVEKSNLPLPQIEYLILISKFHFSPLPTVSSQYLNSLHVKLTNSKSMISLRHNHKLRSNISKRCQ